MTRQTNHTNDPYPMDALLPFNASGLFAGVDASFSLPPGTSLLLVAGLSIIIPLSLVACGKKGVPSLSVRKRDTVLLLGECKAGKTVLFHQVCVFLGPVLLPETPSASAISILVLFLRVQLTSGVAPTTVSSLSLSEKVCKLFADAEDPAASRLRFVDFPGHHRLSRAPFRALDTILGGVKCIIIVLDASDTRGAYLRDVSECVPLFHTTSTWSLDAIG